MDQRPMKVVVGEDHPLMLQAITAVLQSVPEVQIVGQVDTVRGLEECLQRFEPDMMVMDIYIHNQCVLDRLRTYLRDHANVRVLVVSAHDTDLYSQFSRKIGARGFISKRNPPEEFKKAILQVVHGGEVWPDYHPGATTYNPQEKDDLMKSLTLREMEVFQLIGKWRSTEEVADELSISPKTVELHRIHLKEKLKFSSSKELLHYAVDWLEMERSGST